MKGPPSRSRRRSVTRHHLASDGDNDCKLVRIFVFVWVRCQAISVPPPQFGYLKNLVVATMPIRIMVIVAGKMNTISQ